MVPCSYNRLNTLLLLCYKCFLFQLYSWHGLCCSLVDQPQGGMICQTEMEQDPQGQAP